MSQKSKSNKPAIRTTSQASSGSTGSQNSAGIGAGFATVDGVVREDLPPNLTPENFTLDQSIKVYDVIVYLIYCPEHDKIAVTNVERARCVWLPFVCMPEATTWRKASHDGVMQIIGNRDAEQDATVAAKKAPVYEMEYLNLLRIQLPTEKFITRLANLVILKKAKDSTFKCCQRSPRINWLRAVDIFGDRIDKIWGPEVKVFTNLMREMSDTQEKEQETLVSEFTVKNSFHYLDLAGSAEQKLLQGTQVKSEHVTEIYEDFVEHCFPAFGMSFESFKHYLVKKGFEKQDPRLPFLFSAFSLYNKDCIDFHEMLLGLVAMEPSTKNHAEARLKFIFRYYDTTHTGHLTMDEFVVLVQDIAKVVQPSVELSSEQLNGMIEEAIRCVGMTRDQRISEGNFIKAVQSGIFKNTDKLCRSPKPILPQISRLFQAKMEKVKSVSNDGFLVSRRKTKGTCFRCQAQNYAYCLHCVTLDTSGRCVEPRIISEQWIEPCPPEAMNEHKYSIEYIFGNSSMPNIIVDLVKDYYHKCNAPAQEGTKPVKLAGLMATREDWTIFSRYLTVLCEALKGLLTNEDKLIKINAPALVIGDLQGNLHDLLVLEKHYWHSFPVIPTNLVFLGNYTGLLQNGVECLVYLFSLKLLMPNKVFLLRGTNEMRSINKKCLQAECTTKYGPDFGHKVYDTLNNIFERLPFGVIIDETIFCAHSGIPKSNKIGKLNQLPKDIASVYKDAPIGYELLVNQPLGIDDALMSTKSNFKDSFKSQHNLEPSAPQGENSSSDKSSSTKAEQEQAGQHSKKQKSAIGTSVEVSGFTASEHYLSACNFDETAFSNFCQANGFSHMIRSHNIVPGDGFDLRFTNRCITVFSCTNYMQHFASLAGKQADCAKTEPGNICTAAFVDGANSRIRMLAFDTRGQLEPIAHTSAPVGQ